MDSVETFEYEFPVFISISLNEYNLIDNRLAYYLKNGCSPIFLDQDNRRSFIVSITDIKNVMNRYFMSEIQQFGSLNKTNIKRYVNTLYFIHRFISIMPNLRYLKFDISDQKHYTRESSDGDIVFDYSIVSSIIDLPLYFDSVHLKNIKDFFIKNGIIEETKYDPISYFNIHAQDLSAALSLIDLENDFEEGEEPDGEVDVKESVSFFNTFLSDKLIIDNPNITVIIES